MKPNAHALSENDIALIHIEESPAFFARVEEIVPDRKAGWWQVRLLPLVPDNRELETMVWILDDDQIRGEAFTMQSIPVRIQWIEPYASTPPRPDTGEPKRDPGKVITLVKK